MLDPELVGVAQALRWIADEGATRGIDSARIAVAGQSAGAALA